MTLRIHVLGKKGEAPSGAKIVSSDIELISLNDFLIEAQIGSDHDSDIWLADKRLLDLIPRRGSIEINCPQDLKSLLESSYGFLPAGLAGELIDKWLVLPHPSGISVLQLLLARVLALPELEHPGAQVSLTAALEAMCRAMVEVDEPIIHEAWAQYGPPLAVGTSTAPGPVQDPHFIEPVLIARLLASYPQAVRSQVLEATRWHYLDISKMGSLLAALDVPDPRVLGVDRLAGLTVLLRPILQSLPLEDYLAAISGRLEVEFEVLLERLEGGEFTKVGSPEEIQARFRWLITHNPTIAARFQRFVDMQTIAMPLVPPQNSDELTSEVAQEDLSAWSNFFRMQFMPALAAWRRQGCPQDGQLTRALLAADAAFARWIAHAYPKLKGLPSSPLAYREIRRRSKVAANTGPCIVLLIDGFAYELVETFRKEAATAGIRIVEVEPLLASLPTVTNIGMFTAVAGLPHAASSEGNIQLEKARWSREELFRQRVSDAIVQTISQVEQIAEVFEQPSKLYVLVWSDIDFLSHRYANHDLFTEHVQISLRHLLQAIAQAVEVQPHLKQRKDQLRLLISADHGWTDLLKIEPIPRPAINGIRPHHRLYEMSRPISADEIQVLEPNWIAIGGAEYDLPEGRTYLVPAENRPIERNTFRQHGGLSQEEVFVPVLTGAFAQEPYMGLSLTIIAPPLQKDQKTEIHLSLSNPNTVEIKDLRVICTDLDLSTRIEHLSAQSSHIFGPFPIRPRVSGYIEYVQMSLNYEGSLIGTEKLRLEKTLQIARTPEERMAGDYSKLDQLFE